MFDEVVVVSDRWESLVSVNFLSLDVNQFLPTEKERHQFSLSQCSFDTLIDHYVTFSKGETVSLHHRLQQQPTVVIETPAEGRTPFCFHILAERGGWGGI